MAPKRARAAKRARSEAAASDAAGTSAAAGPSGGGPAAENAFDVLPDELVQRIMSLVEVRDAWEVSRMQQVDRRFRRLVRGVEWEEMRMFLKDLVRSQPQAHQRQVHRYLRMVERMTERLRRVEIRGARRVFVSLVSLVGGARDFPPALVKPTPDVADAVLALVAALAVAPLPLEHIDFSGYRLAWPSDSDQRAAGLALRSIQSVASSLLVALAPAKALRSLSADGDLAGALAKACEDLPADKAPAAATLRELVFSNARARLTSASVAAIVRTWPALRHIELDLNEGGGLVELARLPSLEAIVTLADGGDYHLAIERGLVALAGSAGAATRLRELWLMQEEMEYFSHGRLVPYAVTKGGVAAVLSLRSLQRLSIGVDCESAEAIGGLAALKQLRELDLHLYLGDCNLDIEDSENRAAALLDAAAAALEKAHALKRLCLLIEDQLGFAASPPVAGGLVALLRVARPSLVELWLYSDSQMASTDLFREVALCGPKLVSVSLAFKHKSAHNLAPFRELLNLSEDRLPSFKLHIKIEMDAYEAARPPVEATLTGWFSNIPSISLEFASI